jgi:hypothetical protein
MRGKSRPLHGKLLAVACVAAILSAAAAGNVTALHNVSGTLTGVDAARAIVTWPLKADDAPMGIVMAGGTLGNNDVMSRATGDDGSLDQWKGKAKDAAKAAMDEVIEEVMEDDPDDVSSLGKDSSTYKELQYVADKAKKLTVKVAKIGDGGAASASANQKAEAQAEAAAIMAASEAAVTEAYDMPPPPEAAEDAPFARKKTHAGVLKSQKRAVSRPGSKIAVVASHRIRTTPMVKVLATTHKVKGPTHHGLTRKRDVKSGGGGVVSALNRVLSAPLARLMSLDEEDADAPTDEEAAREDAGDAALEEDEPPCAIGTFGPDGGPCSLCPKDTYKDVEGPDECTVCPEGTRTAQEGTSALKDCWDGPMDLESPMGMVMAGPKLSDPEILNKSITSGTIDVWKGKVKDAAKNAVKEVQEEMMEDDLLGVQGENGQTAKELKAVVEKARSMTKKMGNVELGGEWAWSAKKKAEAQADAVAFMAAHEAAVADSYVDDPDNALPLNRKEEVMYPTGHHNMHQERGEDIGYPGGNRPYYAWKGEEEHVGDFPDSSVGGGSKAYYDAAMRSKGAMMKQARLKAKAWTPARLQSLDALWEGIPPDSDGLIRTDPQVDQNVWIGAVAGESPQREQMMEHNLQHSFLAGNTNGPVSLGAVATGSSSGAAGAGFTGVSGSVWHSSWIASSDSSIAAPSPTIAHMKATGSTTKYSKATKAGDLIAQQEAAALTPPGSGMRGPPTQASAASSSTSGCTSDQITLCHAGCDSKLNLEMQSADPEYSSQHKWKTNCMSKCLGPCAKELGFAAHVSRLS